MKKRILFNTILALSIPSICAFPTIAVLAQAQPSTTPPPNQQVTIPTSSAITISFSTPVTFDAGQKKSLPTAATLAHPILDTNGNVVAPVSSPVSIQLQPVKGGAQIIAESIVVGGKVVPIQASSPLIPSKITTTSSSAQEAQANQNVYSQLAGSVFRVFSSGKTSSGYANTDNIGNAVGTGIGIISGLSSPKTTRSVEITQGSMYVLTLQTPVTLPATVLQSPPSAQTPTPTATPSAPPPQTSTPTTTPSAPPVQSQGTPNK